MFKTATITIDGSTFEGPHESASSLKDRSGIYAILDRRHDQKWHMIDVGESETVRTRIENHDRKSCWELHRTGILGIAVLYTPGWTVDQRRQKEAKIRQLYNPPCGDR